MSKNSKHRNAHRKSRGQRGAPNTGPSQGARGTPIGRSAEEVSEVIGNVLRFSRLADEDAWEVYWALNDAPRTGRALTRTILAMPGTNEADAAEPCIHVVRTALALMHFDSDPAVIAGVVSAVHDVLDVQHEDDDEDDDDEDEPRLEDFQAGFRRCAAVTAAGQLDAPGVRDTAERLTGSNEDAGLADTVAGLSLATLRQFYEEYPGLGADAIGRAIGWGAARLEADQDAALAAGMIAGVMKGGPALDDEIVVCSADVVAGCIWVLAGLIATGAIPAEA
jgi:hypothetical protein